MSETNTRNRNLKLSQQAVHIEQFKVQMLRLSIILRIPFAIILRCLYLT